MIKMFGILWKSVAARSEVNERNYCDMLSVCVCVCVFLFFFFFYSTGFYCHVVCHNLAPAVSLLSLDDLL